MKTVVLLVALNVFVVLAFSVAFGQTVYYNNMRGSPTNSNMFFDGEGRMVGSSLQVGNMVTYHDASGHMVGSSMPTTPLPLDTPSVSGDE